MSLVPWELFPALRRRDDLFDEPFRQFFRRPILAEGEVLEPAVEVAESDGEVIVKMEVPGVEKDQLHLTVSADRLTVRGEAPPGRFSTSGGAARWLLALFVVLGSTSLMGAARADETPAASDIEDGASNDYDPWQRFNEKMFFFNHDVFDRRLLKPIAKGWNKALPDVGKRALDRAFDNLGMPRRLVNNLLQGRFRGAGREVARFGVNTTIGVVGFLDVAKAQLHIDSSDADTGQTLGVYGWGPGPYLVLPSLQPLTVRDGIGYGVDGLLDPFGYVTPLLATTGMSVVKQVNKRSLNLELFQDVEDSALDLYSAVRNGYLQRRHGSIEEAIEARHTEWHPPPVKETAER